MHSPTGNKACTKEGNTIVADDPKKDASKILSNQ